MILIRIGSYFIKYGIQEILKKDMDNWCIHKAFYNHQADSTIVKPILSKGEPLWNLSRTDYHSTKIWSITRDNSKIYPKYICESSSDIEYSDDESTDYSNEDF
jgi:hypothetical protein